MHRVHHRRSSYTLRLVTAATIFVASIFGVVRLTAADDGPRTVENSIGMKLTLIAPGKFMMGTKEERAERTGIDYNFPVDIRDEHSQHEVRITRPFILGPTPSPVVSSANSSLLRNIRPTLKKTPTAAGVIQGKRISSIFSSSDQNSIGGTRALIRPMSIPWSS